MSSTPRRLGGRGRRLWDALLAQDPELAETDNPMREVALQACRTADRLEVLDRILIGDAETWMRLVRHPKWDTEDIRGYELRIDSALAEERQQAQSMARLIYALRLPDDASGKKPQRRPLRGVQVPSKVSSIERARAKSGA